MFLRSAKNRRLVVFIYDAVWAFLALPLAFYIRFGHWDYTDYGTANFFSIVLLTALVKIVCFYFFKLFRGIWKYSSTPDLILIFKATGLASVLSFAIFFLYQRGEGLPRSILVIDWAITFFLLGFGRFAYRIWKEGRMNHRDKPAALILGADEGCEQLIRDIQKQKKVPVRIVGLVDDHKDGHGRTIHGVPILGGTDMLDHYVKSYDVESVFLSLSAFSRGQIKELTQRCLDLDVRVRILPRLNDIVGGKVHFSHLRPINIDDLLGRGPIQLNKDQIDGYLKDRIVVVTGAGGSIGKELCLQIMSCAPKKLILVDNCEYNLYQQEQILTEKYSPEVIQAVLGDVRDQARIKEIFQEHRPEVVFHAAAYKHVPLGESNAIELLKTNVVGTNIVAQAASEIQAEKFILISTDKAVNPTNVMGTSKRLAEMISQSIQKDSKTQFIVIRFGNVLGSAGSVIPKFLKQIEQGGPITVTHPEITRFFMSIPEAGQLVLQAAAMGQGGEIFVLDMGSPVKIVDLAQDLIRLSGHQLDEIDIEFSGLRPGEKLYEEVLAEEESTLPTPHSLVRVAKAQDLKVDHIVIKESVLKLIENREKIDVIKSGLQELVPEYKFKTTQIKEEIGHQKSI